jgi:ribosomal protein L14E/L6E/L27E
MTETTMHVFDLIENHGLVRGMVAMSTAGHDSQRIFIVCQVEGRYAWIADGHLRPVERMKKKKVRHLCALGALQDPRALDEALSQVQTGEQNARIRTLIRQFLSARQPVEHQDDTLDQDQPAQTGEDHASTATEPDTTTRTVH